MQGAARSSVTAAAVLAAGSMIAVTPAVLAPPGLHLSPFRLASAEGDIVLADPLAALQADELGFNAALYAEELSPLNADVLTGEESFLSSIGVASPEPTVPPPTADALAVGGPGAPDPALAFDRLFDANNLLLGTYENLFNSVLGADNFAPAFINSSLLIGGATTVPEPYANVEPDLTGPGGFGGGAPFLSGQVGGAEGVAGNSLAADTDFINFLNAQYGLALPDITATDITALGNAFIAFNHALIQDELSFNTNLLTNELAAEHAAFGYSATGGEPLNGVVDRVINIDNLPLSTAENGLNSLIGATGGTISPVRFDAISPATISPAETSPAELTASLLTGVGGTPTDPTNVFDTGDLGGVEGYFDQNAALFADVAGLNSSEITSAFAPGVFDPTAFTTAIGGLFDPTAFSNLGADFTPIVSDLGTIFMGLF